MRFMAVADTDIGISKETNQDSVLVKRASSEKGEVLMAIICDGMGGLAKGELASATVIREFSAWFEREFPYELENLNMQVIGGKWELKLKALNVKISEYGKNQGISLGTTFSGILFAEDQYMFAHVGDSRIYFLKDYMEQLTEDQTFVAREIDRGTMTLAEAETDVRRNMLLQCVGASPSIEPQISYGKIKTGAYMLCSDGFRHKISEQEIFAALQPGSLINKNIMLDQVRALIERVKAREEKDNISAILIKAD